MTSLQNQLAWCVKAQLALAIAMIGMLLGFYFGWYRPENSQLRQRTALIESKRLELESNGTRAGNLKTVKLEVENLRVRLERFDKKLPKQPDFDRFIRDITTLSQQSSLRKLTVQPGAIK